MPSTSRTSCPAVEEWSQRLSKRELTEKLIAIGFSMGMVQNAEDLDSCPQLEARGMFVDCGDTLGGPFRTVKTPIQLTGCEETPTNPPPLLGEHNRDIMCGIGGVERGRSCSQWRLEGIV